MHKLNFIVHYYYLYCSLHSNLIYDNGEQVNFARVTMLHESKRKHKKNKTEEKKLKDKLIKKQKEKKKLLTEGKR